MSAVKGARSSTALSLLLALSAWGQLPPDEPKGELIEILADRQSYDGLQKVLSATGNAKLSTEGAVLRADELRYDQVKQVASARGNVTLAVTQGGLHAAIAESVTLVLEGGRVSEIVVEGGRLMQKVGVSPEALLAARTPEELRRLGGTELTLSGTRLRRVGETEWAVDGLSFTPCDCDPTVPSWRIEASRAKVDLADRHATLTSPTVYVRSVPVLWLPWLYVPLSDRKTGLLIPRPDYSRKNGFSLDAPVFVTLGRSYDATFTPGFFSGGPDEQEGVRGPRLHTEFRYASSQTTGGRATLGLIHDFKPRRDPVTGAALGERRGLRGEATLQHAQALGGNWHDRVDAAFLSDGFLLRDLTLDVLQRETEYLRTTGVVFRRGADSYLGLDVALRQDLRWGYSLFGGDGPNTLHRLPAVTLAIPERRWLGPLNFGLRTELTRIAPFGGGTGDEGPFANEGRPYLDRDGTRVPLTTECRAQRLFYPRPLAVGACDEVPGPEDLGQGDRRFQPGEREARLRLDLNPRLSANLQLGRVASVTPSLSYRQDLYLGEVTGRAYHRGYPLAGLLVDTELSRTFGEGEGALRHSIRPAVELRYVPIVFGREPAPYDELDAAFPLFPGERRFLHGAVELRQQLLRREGSGARELLRLDLGQGFDLSTPDRPRIAESHAQLLLSMAPVNLAATARYAPETRSPTQLGCAISLDNGRGEALYAGYENLLVEGSERARRAIDALVGPPLPGQQRDYAEQLTAGARASTRFGLSAAYDLRLARTGAQPGLEAVQHSLGVSYAPACDCWRLSLNLAQHARADGQALDLASVPSFGLSLTLSRFGTFGAGG